MLATLPAIAPAKYAPGLLVAVDRYVGVVPYDPHALPGIVDGVRLCPDYVDIEDDDGGITTGTVYERGWEYSVKTPAGVWGWVPEATLVECGY